MALFFLAFLISLAFFVGSIHKRLLTIEKQSKKFFGNIPKLDEMEVEVQSSKPYVPKTLVETLKAPQETVLAVLEAKINSTSGCIKESTLYDENLIKDTINECRRTETATSAKEVQDKVYDRCKTKKKALTKKKSKNS